MFTSPSLNTLNLFKISIRRGASGTVMGITVYLKIFRWQVGPYTHKQNRRYFKLQNPNSLHHTIPYHKGLYLEHYWFTDTSTNNN